MCRSHYPHPDSVEYQQEGAIQSRWHPYLGTWRPHRLICPHSHDKHGVDMEFGICFKGFVDADRARYLVRMAEHAGFSYCWFYDSHILWREAYPAMAMLMEHTKNMRFGPL